MGFYLRSVPMSTIFHNRQPQVRKLRELAAQRQRYTSHIVTVHPLRHAGQLQSATTSPSGTVMASASSRNFFTPPDSLMTSSTSVIRWKPPIDLTV